MICSKCLIVFVFVALGCLVAGKDGDPLKAVVVLFRHGDRSPLSSWPNDIYYGNATLWPDGYGQLNNLGKERLLRLGQWLRERYDGFLPKRYNRSDIYVRSTDVDRTLMSAASNLAGLFPPVADQIWNENIRWQAIPVHTTPLDQDPILATSYLCPKYDLLAAAFLLSKEFQKLNDQYLELSRNISKVTGDPLINIASYADINQAIIIYKGFNWSLPEWTETYGRQISALAALDFQLETYTRDLARLRVGPFFDYLLGYFRAVTDKAFLPVEHVKGPAHQSANLAAAPAARFLMLSAHDTTVADRTNAMGVYPDVIPEFGATVIWELKSNANGAYVNMYFKNSTHLSPLTLPGCDFDCNLSNYTKLLTPITTTLDQWSAECLGK